MTFSLPFSVFLLCRKHDKLDYVKVQYTAELYEGTYTETRVYKKGLGLVEFTADNPDGSTFSYSVISW